MENDKKSEYLSTARLTAAALGSFIGIGLIAYLTCKFGFNLLMAPLGASAVLIYGTPDSIFSRPKNVLWGHVLSAIIGTICYHFMGDTWYSMTFAVTLSMLVMNFTETMHPPGGATALICVIQHCPYSFIIMPVLLGSLILLAVAFMLNLISPEKHYPAPK